MSGRFAPRVPPAALPATITRVPAAATIRDGATGARPGGGGK